MGTLGCQEEKEKNQHYQTQYFLCGAHIQKFQKHTIFHFRIHLFLVHGTIYHFCLLQLECFNLPCPTSHTILICKLHEVDGV